MEKKKKAVGAKSNVFSVSAEENLRKIKEIFGENGTLKIRRFSSSGNRRRNFAAIYTESMSDSREISENIVKRLMNADGKDLKTVTDICRTVLSGCSAEKIRTESEAVSALTGGDCVLFADGAGEAVAIKTAGMTAREPTEPENEKVLKGPREGFTENLSDSVSLIQRRLRTPDLKIKYLTLGSRTRTKVALCWLESVADPNLIAEISRKLNSIEAEAILDSNNITEFVSEHRFSPFKTVGSTERPDTAAARLLEGRAAIIVSGSPSVLTVPYLFIENFRSADDYCVNYIAATVGRLLRLLGFVLAISVPAIYTALVTVHKEMMPTALALSVAAARSSVPFPVMVEALGLTAVFEIIRETALRMPSNVSQAFGIVGAVVIGDAAVKAKFVSVPIVIIVSLSALTGLMIPRLRSAVALYRTVLIPVSGALGLYGFIAAILFLLLSLIRTESFGVPYLSYMTVPNLNRQSDVYLRLPGPFLKQLKK